MILFHHLTTVAPEANHISPAGGFHDIIDTSSRNTIQGFWALHPCKEMPIQPTSFVTDIVTDPLETTNHHYHLAFRRGNSSTQSQTLRDNQHQNTPKHVKWNIYYTYSLHRFPL